MSYERHPTINAVGFTLDIIKAVRERIRDIDDSHLVFNESISTKIDNFVEDISNELDKIKGVK